MHMVREVTKNSMLYHGKRKRGLNESITVDHDDSNDLHSIFNGDGYLRDTELKVMNFKPSGCKSTSLTNAVKGKCWEEV